MGGRGERGVGRGLVADLPVEHQIVGDVRPDAGRTGIHDGGEIGDRRQDIVIDLDRFGGIAGLLDAVGNDEGDRVTDMTHHAIGQHRMRRRSLRRAVPVGHQRRAGHRFQSIGIQFRRGVDRVHPGQRGRRGGVDPSDIRRRMRAAQHHPEQHARQHDVIGVAPGALQQPRILDAADGLGEAEFRVHDIASPGLRRRHGIMLPNSMYGFAGKGQAGHPHADAKEPCHGRKRSPCRRPQHRLVQPEIRRLSRPGGGAVDPVRGGRPHRW